jgi:hypothetical protein
MAAHTLTTNHICTMMTPEAAVNLLLLLAQQEPHELPWGNLSIPFNDVRLPPAADLYYRCDCYCIQSILQDGLMPKVDWQKVKVEVIFELGRFLHSKVRAHFDTLSSTNQAKLLILILSSARRSLTFTFFLTSPWYAWSPFLVMFVGTFTQWRPRRPMFWFNWTNKAFKESKPWELIPNAVV